jgi:hypothetical protein
MLPLAAIIALPPLISSAPLTVGFARASGSLTVTIATGPADEVVGCG